MKNRKRLVIAGAALLALVAVGLMRGRQTQKVFLAVDTAASMRPNAVGAAPAGREQMSASAGASSIRTNAVAAGLSPRGTKTVRITAHRTVTASLRRELSDLGARVIAPVGSRSVLAEATPGASRKIAADPRFTAEDVLPAAKVASVLSECCAKSPQKRVRVNVIGLSSADRDTLVSFVTAGGGTVGVCPLGPEALTAEVSPALVASLAARGDVRWIEPALERQLLNDQTVVTEGANIDTLRTVHHLRGRGQKVTVCDTGLDTGLSDDVHWDFFGRVREIVHVGQAEAKTYGYTPTLADYNGHGTHVAGTVLGDGARSDGLYKGMAQAAELYFQACSDTKGKGVWMDSYEGLLTKSLANKSYIHSNSWGSKNSWGRYDAVCAAYDTVLWSHPEILVVVAAGNDGERGEGSVCSHPACSKNVLTVGNTMSSRPTEDWLLVANPTNLNPSSGRGPTCDGRIKPEIAAPGTAVYSPLSTKSLTCTAIAGNAYYTEMTGTSMATPLVSGAAALVREWLVDRRDFTNALPTAALMKAILAGGGVAMTGVGAELTGDLWKKFSLPQVLPNADYGWGRVNLEETLYPTNGRSVRFVDRIPFGNGVTNAFDIVTTNAAPLDIQLCWIDYPADASTDEDQTLINDLDLIVSNKTTGAVWLGNGVEGGDHLNTMESVRIPLAEKGEYAVLVAGHSVSYEDGGAAAVYVRGAFADETKPSPEYVVNDRTGENYDCLDAALREVGKDDVLRVRNPVLLNGSVTVPKTCTVVSDPADPTVRPVVCSSAGSVVTVPAGVAFEIKGLAFTNVCHGFDVAGRLEVTQGASFDALAALTVEAGGRAVFADMTIEDDAVADWQVAGTQTLQNVRLAPNQTVTVAAAGNLTLSGGITNLTKIALASASADGLTLAGVLESRIDVDAPNACASGMPFGVYTCPPEVAEASAPLLVNIRDPEGELGGQAAGGILRWAIVQAPPGAAGSRVDIGDARYYYYAFKTALRQALETNVAATVTVVKDSDCAQTVTLTHDLTLTAETGAALALSNAAQFVVSPGAKLLLTNVVIRGGENLADCAFKVTGGELTLASGTVLSALCDSRKGKESKRYGGSIVVTSGTVTMESGCRIADCSTLADGGGALWIGGANSTANLFGGEITGCSAPNGGAVYACSKAKVNVGGDFRASDNVKRDGETASNLYLFNDTVFTLTNELTGAVGLSYLSGGTPNRNATNVCFVATGAGLSEAAKTNSAACFSNDIDANLEGKCVGGVIVWMERPPYDGTCDTDPSKATVWAYREGSLGQKHYYENLNLALKYVTWESPLYVMKDLTLTNDVEIARAVVLARDADLAVSPKVYRAKDAMYRIVSGGSLTVTNLTIYGVSRGELSGSESESTVGLFSVNGGTLTLKSGVLVGVVRGKASRAANAISVFNGGTLTMESGAVISNCCNCYANPADATSCGGGVLLDGAAAYFRGGTVRDCSAFRAGGVYVANRSKAHVSGAFVAENNADLAGAKNNFVVSANSSLILAGELTGSVGVNEGIAGDTNAFATVEWDWADTNVLRSSAARFVHDIRGAHGVAVTNAAKEVALVWDDTLTKGGKFVIDGDDYRIFLEPGQTVAVPKAFSIGAATGANGKLALSLEGGVEGCWYTVYSTEDLNVPFTVEASVQLQEGETFEYEIDRTKSAKFYKVIGEEGLR